MTSDEPEGVSRGDRPRTLTPGPRTLTPRNVAVRVILLGVLTFAIWWMSQREPAHPPGLPDGARRDAGAGEVASVQQVSGRSMGTTWNVTAIDAPLGVLEQGRVQRLLDQVDASMSTWKETSEISQFNTSRSTERFPVSPEFFEVVRVSQEVAERSGGALDITVEPLVELWGFNTGAKADWRPPTENEVQALIPRLGFRKLEARDQGLTKAHPELEIDLSAVAKGYAVDQVARWLEAQGLRRYMVEVGGEVRVLGHNAKGKPWQIGVERPEVAPARLGPSVLQVVPVTSGAVATSGTYRNLVTAKGERFAHAIDPVALAPVRHNLVSVTVLHPECVWADAWATALLVLGPARGPEVATREGLAALFLSEGGEAGLQRTRTPAFEALMGRRGDSTTP